MDALYTTFNVGEIINAFASAKFVGILLQPAPLDLVIFFQMMRK